MLKIRMINPGLPADVIETHPDVTTIAGAKKVLGQWTQKGDMIDVIGTVQTAAGDTMTSLVIITPDGEPLDLFAQLITKEDAQ